MARFAGRNIPGKSLCKGVRDTRIKKGDHAVVLKGGSTGKLSSIRNRRQAKGWDQLGPQDAAGYTFQSLHRRKQA